MVSQKSVLIIAGGTGGHIVPGLGLALELATERRVHFLSLEKNREYADFATLPFPIAFYDAPPLSGLRSARALLSFPLRFARALIVAWRLLGQARVDFVIGMGGYSIFPGIVAARLRGIPYYLCEQNAVPGRATRLFAPGARRIFLNFPIAPARSSAAFQVPRALLTGNPLRPRLRMAAKKARAKRKKTRRPGLTALVLGGSQGATQINSMVAGALAHFATQGRVGTRRNPIDRWILQCGAANVDAMRAQFPEWEFPHVRLLGYYPGIEEFYAAADLLICRAGAGVLSEGLAFGLPMILIPYPFAADNHQLANAEYLAAQGAAVCLNTRASDPALLIETLRIWTASPRREIQERSAAAAALARPDAAQTITRVVLTDAASNFAATRVEGDDLDAIPRRS
jgi:UDP-N-acetylglucosamine--N-acetylmuramyl-(pentapeptide) pyrophosphoryl-undecaprenol N-acetylglucosamine transferase